MASRKSKKVCAHCQRGSYARCCCTCMASALDLHAASNQRINMTYTFVLLNSLPRTTAKARQMLHKSSDCWFLSCTLCSNWPVAATAPCGFPPTAWRPSAAEEQRDSSRHVDCPLNSRAPAQLNFLLSTLNMDSQQHVRVAVVGSGMAGLVTAHLLKQDRRKRYAVKVFESVCRAIAADNSHHVSDSVFRATLFLSTPPPSPSPMRRAHPPIASTCPCAPSLAASTPT